MPWFDDPRDNPVQAAQNEYLDTMEIHWQRVIAGEISHAEYWRIADGEPAQLCSQKIAAAVAAFEADHPPRRHRPSRRERAWKRWTEQDNRRRDRPAPQTAGQIMARTARIRP